MTNEKSKHCDCFVVQEGSLRTGTYHLSPRGLECANCGRSMTWEECENLKKGLNESKPQSKKTPVRPKCPTCPTCESCDIDFEAVAQFDAREQDSVIVSTYEKVRCNSCNSEGYPNWEDLKVFEVVGAGFDGSTDETDDRVLHVAAPSMSSVLAELDEVQCTVTELDSRSFDDVDFYLPGEGYSLRERALSFVKS